MFSRKLVLSACAAAMFATVNAAPAFAQTGAPLDERTEFTFNSPVDLPGVTLQPGTYVFRFADAANSPRRVIQVVDKADRSKTYGMFLTIAAERRQPSEKAELRFMETPAGTPTAVKTWWYPGNPNGREFIYSRTQAQRLAKATNTNVLTTKQENVAQTEFNSAELTYVTPSGQEQSVNETDTGAQQVAAAPAPSPAPQNTTATTAPVQESTSAANTTHRTRLPRTGTELPLLALLGLTSLAGGSSLRFRR